MAQLTLTGVSDDGSQLLLVGDQGTEFTLDITPSLRAALRDSPARASRLGQLETTMDSSLRPRDIQARIRAGESAEAVAAAGHTDVDKIMAWAGPVLAEREHVAQRAQKSTVRRRGGESAGPSRTLGDAAEAHLRSCNVDPSIVEWDSWRREDGRWALVGVFSTTQRSGTAQFTFDLPGNYVVVDNEDARWLIGETVASPAPARDDLQNVRQRRLSSVPEDELPLGDDAIELVSDDVPLPTVAEGSQPGPEPEQALPVEAFFADEPPEPAPSDRDAPADAADESAPADDDAPPARRTVQKKRGRASVPSWDEIMFGGGDNQ